MINRLILFPLFISFLSSQAQSGYWQQHVDYNIDIDMDTKTHQFTGTQKLVYTNNSPDTLKQVFYHLYYNAFQPGTMMAERTANLPDPDKRMKGKFHDLKVDEIGFQKVKTLTQNGQPLNFDVVGTILQVPLNTPLLPGSSDTFQMAFHAQIPLMIRRTGRHNSEGIDYTMTQWYPKMCAYDTDGWHPDQYLGREFYGVWGDFRVAITIDEDYVIGGTGVLKNPDAVNASNGKPKRKRGHKKKGSKKTWVFFAKQVHDFAWAADPDFRHHSFEIDGGPTVNLYYNPKTANTKNWQNCQDEITTYFNYMAEHFGPYAYPQFSLIQGGDGGMEYPMCTMMLGSGKGFKGFIGLFAHEASHNWYYGMLGSNEQRYQWMDEGFTSYAEAEALDYIFKANSPNPHFEAVTNYRAYVLAGGNATMTTPADHFDRKIDYTVNAYYKGEMFLMQLKYIVGKESFNRAMLAYYTKWRFKNPRPEDFMKIVEDESGLQLDWFYLYWTQLSRITDYAISSVEPNTPNGMILTLTNNGGRPMPVDIEVTFKNQMQKMYTIPLVSMYGYKPDEVFEALPDWPWTRKTYQVFLPLELEEIEAIQLDPYQESGDIFPANNRWVQDAD